MMDNPYQLSPVGSVLRPRRPSESSAGPILLKNTSGGQSVTTGGVTYYYIEYDSGAAVTSVPTQTPPNDGTALPANLGVADLATSGQKVYVCLYAYVSATTTYYSDWLATIPNSTKLWANKLLTLPADDTGEPVDIYIVHLV